MKIQFGKRNLVAAILVATAMDITFAQVETAPTTIKRIRTGWGDDVFAVEPNGPIVNPANCSAPDAYAIGIASPGYKTHLAAALVAYSSRNQLIVIVSNYECAFSRPKIIAIYLM